MSTDTVTCFRCGAREKIRKAVDWNGEFRNGRLVAVLCPACQTPEEDVEARVNEATLVYGADDRGRVIGRPKGDAS